MAKAAILLHKATQRFELDQFSSLAGDVGLQQVVPGNHVRSVRFNVRFGSLADILTSPRHVRIIPITDIRQCRWDVRKVPLADIRVRVETRAVKCWYGSLGWTLSLLGISGTRDFASVDHSDQLRHRFGAQLSHSIGAMHLYGNHAHP